MATLLSTKSFPPVIGGSAFLLYELLEPWAQDELVVVHGVNDPPINGSLHLPFVRKQVLFLNSPLWTLRLQRRFPALFLRLIERQLTKMVKEQDIGHIYAHYPNAAFVVAAYKVAKRHKLPLTIYYDILWEEYGKRADRKLAIAYERQINEYAMNHFAITEFAADFLSRKHNKSFKVIPHTLRSKFLPNQPSAYQGEKLKFHFAGGIYPRMNKDAVLRVYQAICALYEDFEFEICTDQLPEELRADPRVVKQYYSKEDLILSQKNSHLLILPQAFESDKPQMIKNNFPTKTMEYACSGTPILVHSPADSYLSWVAKEYGFGAVVDQADIEPLKLAIQQIIKDESYRQQLFQGALSFAKSRLNGKWSNFLKKSIAYATE